MPGAPSRERVHRNHAPTPVVARPYRPPSHPENIGTENARFSMTRPTLPGVYPRHENKQPDIQILQRSSEKTISVCGELHRRRRQPRPTLGGADGKGGKRTHADDTRGGGGVGALSHSAEDAEGKATTRSPSRKPAWIGTEGSCKRARGVRDAGAAPPAAADDGSSAPPPPHDRLSSSRPSSLAKRTRGGCVASGRGRFRALGVRDSARTTLCERLPGGVFRMRGWRQPQQSSKKCQESLLLLYRSTTLLSR